MKLTVKTLRDLVSKAVTEKLIQDECGGGQRWHKADGTWGSKKNAKSWSWDDKDCEEHGQYKVVSGKKTKDTADCGRKDRRTLCSEDESHLPDLYKREKIERLIRQTIKQELAALRRDSGGCTYNQVLAAMNKMDRARTGDLYSKK
jgi:hypothetical protein